MSLAFSSFRCLQSRSYIYKSLTVQAYRNFKSAPTPPARSTWKWRHLIIASVAGAGIGSAYEYYSTVEKQKKSILQSPPIYDTILKKLPDAEISRTINYPNDTSGLEFILFQYQTCPFCCKVRAFMDYHGLSYKIVEVNPVMRQQLKWSNYRKVPILLVKVNDSTCIQLKDSSMIISALSSFIKDRKLNLQEVTNYYPTVSYVDDGGDVKNEILNKYFIMYNENKPDIKKDVAMEERKWRKWADDSLVHTLSPNVYRSLGEAVEAFKWFSQVGEWETHFNSLERLSVVYVGAFAMWIIGKRIKKRHCLKEDVRQSLYDNCNEWTSEIKKKGTTFHGGSSPDLADLAIFGVLNSIEGCTAFSDVLDNTNLRNWYDAMKDAIANQKGSYLAAHR